MCPVAEIQWTDAFGAPKIRYNITLNRHHSLTIEVFKISGCTMTISLLADDCNS